MGIFIFSALFFRDTPNARHVSETIKQKPSMMQLHMYLVYRNLPA